jgi:hypothetical protein
MNPGACGNIGNSINKPQLTQEEIIETFNILGLINLRERERFVVLAGLSTESIKAKAGLISADNTTSCQLEEGNGHA